MFRPKVGDKVVAIVHEWRDIPNGPFHIGYSDDEPRREMHEVRIPGRIEMRPVFVNDKTGIAMVPEAYVRFEAP